MSAIKIWIVLVSVTNSSMNHAVLSAPTNLQITSGIYKAVPIMSKKQVYGPLEQVSEEATVQCFVKTTSRLVTRLLNYASAVAGIVLGLGIFLAVSTLCGCALACGRKRKRATEPDQGLCTQLFCPCCIPGPKSAKHRPLRDDVEMERRGDFAPDTVYYDDSD